MRLKLSEMLEGPVGMIMTVVLGLVYVYIFTGMFGAF